MTFYSVIQYIPDIVRNERANIAVVAYLEDEKKVLCSRDFKYALTLGAELESLQNIVMMIELMTVFEIRKASAVWKNAIQFSAPAFSLLSLEETLDDAAKRYL